MDPCFQIHKHTKNVWMFLVVSLCVCNLGIKCVCVCVVVGWGAGGVGGCVSCNLK
jgi:hypothetical protein